MIIPRYEIVMVKKGKMNYDEAKLDVFFVPSKWYTYEFSNRYSCCNTITG